MANDKKERARTEDGKFVGDDPTTPDVNEAFKPVKYYLMQEGLANTILQKLASLPYAEVSDMLTAFRAMQNVSVDPTTKTIIGKAEDDAGKTED
tara:strand:+ start:1013 stop:1294 length:282 start_codon:yes stop_codon:yes gene_type:complete